MQQRLMNVGGACGGAKNVGGFIDFCPSYDTRNYIARHRAAPKHTGSMPAGGWRGNCLHGKPTMFPGATRIRWVMSDVYTDRNTIDSGYVESQEVTWIGQRRGIGAKIGNELCTSRKYGHLIDNEDDAFAAGANELASGSTHNWPGKEENTKTPKNPGSRYLQAMDSGRSCRHLGIPCAEIAAKYRYSMCHPALSAG